MKVQLISASYPTPFTFHRKFLGLGYIHAHALADKTLAREISFSHEFYDTREMRPKEIADAIRAGSPDVAAFGCYVWNTALVLEIVAALKAMAPEVQILLGGPEVDYHYEQVLKKHDGVDFISVGEGEETFRAFLHARLKGDAPLDVAGLALRRGGAPSLAEARVPATNLDAFPSPHLAGVIDFDETQRGTCFQTTRGCPFNCAYCDFGRSRPCAEFSLERAKAELDFFKAEGMEKIFCVDSTFNLNKERAVELLNYMADIKLESALWVEAHPSLLDEAFVEAVGRTHLTYLGLGVQTTHPEAMKNINRTWNPDKIGALLKRLAVHENCLLGLEVIMGLPGDNLQTFKNSISWVYEKEPANVFAFNLEVLPQTELLREAKRFSIVEAGVECSHEIISNCTFPEDQILMGKAITAWNRQMQSAFFRLARITGLAAGDLIEGWAWYAYHAGLHDRLTELHANQVDPDLLVSLADLFEKSCAELLAAQNLPDVSRQLREFLRYLYSRRAATRDSAVFTDAPDVNCISTNPKHNTILTMIEAKKTKLPAQAREETFEYDMRRLWPMKTAEELSTLTPEPHTYLFHTGPRGEAVVVEKP